MNQAGSVFGKKVEGLRGEVTIDDGSSISLHLVLKLRDFSAEKEPSKSRRGDEDEKDHSQKKLEGQANPEAEERFKGRFHIEWQKPSPKGMCPSSYAGS